MALGRALNPQPHIGAAGGDARSDRRMRGFGLVIALDRGEDQFDRPLGGEALGLEHGSNRREAHNLAGYKRVVALVHGVLNLGEHLVRERVRHHKCTKHF